MLVFAASKRRAKDGGRVPLEIWALAVTFTALGAAVRLPASLAPRTACLAPSAREVVTEAMETWGRECDCDRGATETDGEPSQPPACHVGDFQPFTRNLRFFFLSSRLRSHGPWKRLFPLVTRFHRTRRFLKPTSHRDESCADRESETGGEPSSFFWGVPSASERTMLFVRRRGKVHRKQLGLQCASHVFRSAMPRGSSPDLTNFAVLGVDDDEDEEPIGAVASIQAAARKGTRPVVKLPIPGELRRTRAMPLGPSASHGVHEVDPLDRPLTRVSFRLVSSINSLPFANRSRVVRRRLRRDGRRTPGPHPRAHRQNRAGSTPADAAETQQG